jgi:hypothetical protein
MLYGLIVAVEIGFWLVLLAGLTVRYGLRRRRAGAVLLAAAPMLDVVLLAAGVLDLHRGATAGPQHGLAAVYIGVSVAFGPVLIRWADTRFAHRFAGGPAPVRPPKHGRAHAAYERGMWLRHLLAWAVGVGLLGLAALLVGGQRTAALRQIGTLWTVVLVVDFAISFSYTVFPRQEASNADTQAKL